MSRRHKSHVDTGPLGLQLLCYQAVVAWYTGDIDPIDAARIVVRAIEFVHQQLTQEMT